MSDLNLYHNSRPETPEVEPHAPMVITDSGNETHALTDGADAAPGSHSDLGGQMHKEFQAKETDLDARIAQLNAEIQQLSHETPETSPEKQSPHGALGGMRSYCQHVVSAIGSFFMAVFGHAEPNLDSKEAHVEEVKHKINMDTQELKMLQQTRQAYQELDQRIAGLEQSAAQEQQDAIHSRTEELQIKEQTQQLFQSLILSLRGDRTDSDAAPETSLPPDDPSRGDGRDIETPSSISTIEDQRRDGSSSQPENLPQPTDNRGDDSNLTPADNPLYRAPQPGDNMTPYQAPQPGDNSPFTPEPAPGVEPVKPTDTPQDGVRIIGDQNQETDNALVHTQGQNEYHDANTCGVVTQEMILNRLTGTHDFTESGLANEAASHGWFKPGEGSPLGQVGNLLETHGFQVEHRASSLEEMAEHLAKGEQVIAGVNAGKMGDAWASDPMALGDGSVNHVVWVSGVRVETHDGVSHVIGVIVHDSGVGKSYELSADQFKQAWEPSNNHAIYVSPTPGIKGA